MAKKKTNFFKNVVVTNLPALAALILMAVALHVTLKFNVILSFIVLLIVYFFLGVTVELILDKLNTRKKKNELFKKYTTGAVENEKTKETEPVSFSLEELLRSASDSEPKAEEPSENPVIEKPLTAPKESIPVPVEPVSGEDDLLNSLTTGGFELEETEEEIEEEYEEPEFEEPAFEEEEPEAEEEIAEETTEEEQTAEDDFLNITVSDFEKEEPARPAEDIDLFFKDLFAGDLQETQAPEKAPAPEKSQEEEESSFDADSVQEVLREVNEKKDFDTPRSIFEKDSFDVNFESDDRNGAQKGILFESVPDTEDDVDFTSYEDAFTMPAAPAPQKGKVRVDPQKIDELYTITRDRKEGSIFGRRKKK